MTPADDDRHALKIYRQALDESGPDRERFIRGQCGEDHALEAAVRDLMKTSDDTGVLDRAPSNLLHADSDVSGDWIGPYRVLETIGRGGMGIVYLAEQREPIERRVALKLIQPGLQTDEIRARFEGERRALAIMSHPNIARVFDAGHTEDGRPYFAMEHVPGQTITDFANSQRLTVDERLKLFLEVLDAVRHAHQKGIIHRDIKPGNVLVGSAEGRARVKVIDFGVAKAVDRRLTPDTVHTWSGRLVGTLEFMSPEQVGAERSVDDTRSDVYACAMLLYELLVGALPFDRERFESSSLAEIHHLICEAEPPKPSHRISEVFERGVDVAVKRQVDPSQLARVLRGDLDAIVMKGLEKAVTRRYQSAGEFRDDIVRYLEDRPIEARPPSATYQMKKFVRRHRVPVAAALLIFVAVTSGMIVAWHGLSAAERALVDVKIESAKWRAALTFFEDMLASASPETVQGRDAPVLLEAVQFAADRAGTQLEQFPEGEASVRCTIAKVFLSLGRIQDAQKQVTLAEKRYALLEEPPPTLSAEVLHSRGVVELALGNLENATTALNECLEVVGKIPIGDPKRSFLRSRVRMELCQVLLHTRDHDRAERLAREAIEIAAHSNIPAHDRLAFDNQLALVLKAKGQFPEAERLYRQCLERSRSLGENHPFTPQFESNLGMLLLFTDRAQDAEVLFRSSLETRLRVLGPKHERLAESYNNLALAEQNLKKIDAAIENFMNAREILEGNVGPTHPHLASLSFNIAELYEQNGDALKAVPEYQRAVAIDESNYGAEHLYVARGRFQLARALFRSGNAKDAEPIAKDAVRSYEGAKDVEPWRLGRAKSLLGACLAELARFEEAEVELLDAFERTHAELGPEHKRTLTIRSALRKLYETWGKPEKQSHWQ